MGKTALIVADMLNDFIDPAWLSVCGAVRTGDHPLCGRQDRDDPAGKEGW